MTIIDCISVEELSDQPLYDQGGIDIIVSELNNFDILEMLINE